MGTIGLPKLQCSFCGRTNTKLENKYVSVGLLGLREEYAGTHEVIDKNAPQFYRCTMCGSILCYNCLRKMGAEKGFLVKRMVCPACGAKLITIGR